jgi:hypothetical protein
MRHADAAGLIGVVALAIAGAPLACAEREAPRGAAPGTPAIPTSQAQRSPAAPDAAPIRDAATDRLTFGQRLAIAFAKRKEEAKLAAELAAQEKARVMKFDKSKIAKHAALLAFIKKARKQLDDAAARVKGKPDAAAAIGKLQASMRKPLEAQAKALRSIDPKGGNSNITTDHDVSLNYLANDYPEAIAASFAGDEKPLQELRAEMDKRQQKVESYLTELRAGGGPR